MEKYREIMTKEEMPRDFWNYNINPITGIIIQFKGSRAVTEEDVRTRRYSKPGNTQ